MLISMAQREMHSAFLGGSVGQLVAGVIWAASAAVSTWGNPIHGKLFLFFASLLLFPLTQGILRLRGRPGRLRAENSLGQLAMQVAFTVPLGFLLVAPVTLYRESWFYPASMVVVGAHYLPFMFLYGMWQFGALAGLLVSSAVWLGLYGPKLFSLGGWLSAALLTGFALVAYRATLSEERRMHTTIGEYQ